MRGVKCRRESGGDRVGERERGSEKENKRMGERENGKKSVG